MYFDFNCDIFTPAKTRTNDILSGYCNVIAKTGANHLLLHNYNSVIILFK